MDQQMRLAKMIELLVAENPHVAAGEVVVPEEPDARYRLWRSLVNVREPRPAGEGYLALEDAFLAESARTRGVTRAADLPSFSAAEPHLHLWQGDITTLAADAIVNAANDQLLGCFVPCHGCIDNAIHTAAGVRLRLACAELVAARGGSPEPTGRAQITPGFNLPAAHVIHTVGPIVRGRRPTTRDRRLLASCYESCLSLAAERGLTSIAFCCISTGEFGYPAREAAEVAVSAVRGFLADRAACGLTPLEVTFDVFSDADLCVYQDVLGRA